VDGHDRTLGEKVAHQILVRLNPLSTDAEAPATHTVSSNHTEERKESI
jgi:hypothetical protein